MSPFPVDPRAPKGDTYARPYVYHIKGDPIGQAAMPKLDSLIKRLIRELKADKPYSL